MVKIASVHHIQVVTHKQVEYLPVDLNLLEETLSTDPNITHVAVVHCETTTGIINPVVEAGEIIKRFGRSFLVDAMSSFGAYPLDLTQANIHFLVSSSNKCIEGVPGFSFILAEKDALQIARGNARSVSLDLVAQWDGLEGDGQFRFTPPTHALLAFHQALLELEIEGGVDARAARYRRNYELTIAGMQDLGFVPYLPEENRGHTITSFLYPENQNFSFSEFYQRLSQKGCVIYPGKVSQADCFRIGHIGRLDRGDVLNLLAAVRETLLEMHIEIS
jgi:2-aminoethylphosphonate-pyruvate transaminase